MNAKLLKLAAKFLSDYSQMLGNSSCNDWDWPKDFTRKEIRELVREMYELNGDPENFDPNNLDVSDFMIVDLLSAKLEKCARDLSFLNTQD